MRLAFERTISRDRAIWLNQAYGSTGLGSLTVKVPTKAPDLCKHLRKAARSQPTSTLEISCTSSVQCMPDTTSQTESYDLVKKGVFLHYRALGSATVLKEVARSHAAKDIVARR